MSDRTVPVRTVSTRIAGVVDEPWRTASADADWSRLDELARLSRIGRNPGGCAAAAGQGSAVMRRRKLIVAAGLGRDDHADRRTVLLDPAADISADTADVVRLGRSGVGEKWPPCAIHLAK